MDTLTAKLADAPKYTSTEEKETTCLEHETEIKGQGKRLAKITKTTD